MDWIGIDSLTRSGVVQLLNDQNSEVRLNVISNLEEGNKVNKLLYGHHADNCVLGTDASAIV